MLRDVHLLTKRRKDFSPKRLTTRDVRLIFNLFILIFACRVLGFAQPEKAVDLYNRANIQAARGNLDKALDDYTKALETVRLRIEEKNSQDHFSKNLNRLDRSVEDASQINANDSFTAKVLMNCAIVRYRKGEIDDAIADLNAVLRINPGSLAAYLARGVAKRAKGELQDALADFNRVLGIDGESAEAYNDRADVLLDLGSVDGAFADLNHALALNPRFPGTHYQLGYACIAQRDFSAAIVNFDKAIQLDAKMSGAYQGRGTARMAKRELDSAIADFSRALEINPNRAETYENRGLAFLILGKTTEAEEISNAASSSSQNSK